GIFGEPSDSGLAASLDALIDSFHTLASNPVDPAGRALVVANATALTDKFRSIDSRLEAVSQNIGAQLADVIRNVNGLVTELSGLNGQIRQAGGNAADLLDRRDAALDQLAQFVDVRIIERGQGTVDVLLGGLQLVTSGGGTQQLSVSGSGPYQLQLGNPPVPIGVGSGQIKGLFDSFNAIGARGTPATRATGLRGQLDDLALGIVAAVNQIHSDYDPGTKALQPTLTPAPSPLRTIGPLFDPAGVTAGSIRLDSAVLADSTQIAAGYSTNAGDNSIALRLAELRELAVAIPGSTGAGANSPAVAAGPTAILGEYYTAAVSGLGVTTRDAGTRASAQSILVANLEAQRQDVSGVNIDEEMVRLIEHQQAYVAAARLVQAADEMLRELINLGR
ncbi:MAG: flagellar hook-associated protein FlgK, partial [Gemmatimonadales bacterium]